jgi:hypothetical protein
MTYAQNLADSAQTLPAGIGGAGLMFRNRIINGDMRIDQRNAGASVTANDNVFVVDRFRFSMTQSSKGTGQQSTTAPAGYINSIVFTSSAATSVGASDQFAINQNIEGLNITDLGWGSASALSVTLSFWVRSSLTGTFGGVLQNSSGNRSYPFTYTISAANTWEQKTVTVPGDTTGTWLTTNGIGLRLWLSLGMGSTYSGTAGAWAGANYQSATGATSVVGTNGATFYITGVQLEVGSTATQFERRPHGMELALCQRYHQGGGSTSASIQAANYKTVWFAPLTVTTGQAIRLLLPMKTSMRSTPTVTYEDNNGNVGKCYFNGTNATVSNYNATSETVIAVATAPGNSSSVDMWINYVLDSEL